MLHKMKLNESPFEGIKNGTKTIEFRLYDEKRQQIKVGDKIEFSKLPDLQEKLLVDVIELYREDTFGNLFRKLYADEDEINRKTKSMYQYYSGRKSKYRILNDSEYLTELNKKVLEEANEFIEENSIEELGDLMEVINAIMKLKSYKIEEVYKIMKAKADKKGTFDSKIYLEYVDEEKRNIEEEKELNKKFRK